MASINFSNDVKNILSQFDTLNINLKKNVWILNNKQINDFTELKDILSEGEKEINDLLSKLDDPYMKCSVFGCVSAGKSTFINSLLGQKLLPSGNSTVTNSLIQIQKCEDGSEGYLEFDGKRWKLDEITKINAKSTIYKEFKIFYSPNSTLSSLPDDLIIFDTPGIDFDKEMDEAVKKQCDKSNIIVLLLHSRTALGQLEKQNITKLKTQFTTFNVFMIFNFWDEIYEDTDVDQSKINNTKYVMDFFVNDLNISNESAKNRIHFISAKNALDCIESGKEDKIWSDDYNKMKSELMKEMTVNQTERHNFIKMEIINILKKMMSSDKSRKKILVDMVTTMFSFVKKVKEIKDTIKCDVKSSIEKEINGTLHQFSKKCLELVKNENPSVKPTIKETYKVMFVAMIEKIKDILLELIECNISGKYSELLDRIFDKYQKTILSQFGDTEIDNLIENCKEFNRQWHIRFITDIGANIISTALARLLGPFLFAILGIKLSTSSTVDMGENGSLNPVSNFIDSYFKNDTKEQSSNLSSSLKIESLDSFMISLVIDKTKPKELENLLLNIENRIKELETKL